jgi:hypothetical protein
MCGVLVLVKDVLDLGLDLLDCSRHYVLKLMCLGIVVEGEGGSVEGY